jgi:predicted lipoprotein with Yx(FWY)xxD motif
MTKHDAKLGEILADAQGLTLYTLTNNGKAVDCTGGCAAVWPPLTAASGAQPAPAPGVGMLGTATLSDGTRVVTAGGLPVYRFAQDGDAGDAYGEGMATFGGVWHVVHAGQSTASAAPVAPAAGRTTAQY